ncbi:alpha/beta fold hydrolase [Agromyces aureus]|uniref:AB hydrolase-1 domain-containing protein n=1 Tax=Agromyces aureus TaxID=453304 RepID=A0A191WJE9_9MICO|nr:alpha/beta hydrolase [Agromyces aureus]ANJ28342.1 hypothetical protein ATC03_18195 [Agromyces aureus]
MTTTVLILPGAGLPDWLWDDVRARLTTTSVIAPRPVQPNATVSDYARSAIDALPPGPFLVVAHSAGGVVATELARLAPPARMTGVVAVAAVIPATGGSFVSSLPFPQKIVLPAVLRVAGTRPPESAVRKGLAADVDEETTRRLVADLVPEPRTYFTSRVGSNEALRAATVRRYLVSANDAELPPALQDRFAERLAPHQTIRLDDGHLPMLTNPEAVAAAVSDALAPAPNTATT